MSFYDSLSNDEKFKLFQIKNDDHYYWSGASQYIKEDSQTPYLVERKAYETYYDYLIKNGAGMGYIYDSVPEHELFQIKPDENVFLKIYHYETIHTKDFPRGITYNSKRKWPVHDVYYGLDGEWCRYNGYMRNGKKATIRNIEISHPPPSVGNFTDIEITVYKIKKTEKFKKILWGSGTRTYVEIIKLFPFFENKIKIDNDLTLGIDAGHIPTFLEDKNISDSKRDSILKRYYSVRPLNFWKFIEDEEYKSYHLNEKNISFLKGLYKVLDEIVIEMHQKLILDPLEAKNKEKIKVQSKIKKIILSDFDKNNNGELDILEGTNVISELLDKNESQIVEFDHNFIHDIIKLNEFLSTKKDNLIKIFEIIKGVETEEEMDITLEVLKLSIENYQSLLLHSINMIVSVKEKKLTSYYEIRNCFDKLNIFNSNWENEVSGKLDQIDMKLSTVISSLNDISSSIRSLEITTRNSINNLAYVTKSSFKSLQTSVVGELKSINRGVGLNNLISAVNTYQLYKLNKN